MHINEQEIKKLLLNARNEIWSNPIFLKTLQSAKILDEAVSKLEKIDTSNRVTHRQRYRQIKSEQPAYNKIILLQEVDFEKYIESLSMVKKKDLLVELYYQKSLLESTVLNSTLRNFIAEINYKTATYGKPKIGINPDVLRAPARPSRRIGPDEDR